MTMTGEAVPEAAPPDDSLENWRSRALRLERQLSEIDARSREALIRSELRAEALRAGLVDLDGLRLIDTAGVTLAADGAVEGVAAVVQAARRAKPWLFAQPSSSIAAAPPPAQPPRQKPALEMSAEEYRSARAALLRRG